MAQPPKGNVVPLDDHPRARSRLSKKESADVLAGCRQLALDRIKSALSGMLERIAVSEMSRKLKAACEGELVALSQRMGFLLERPEMEDDANPMSPATICAALKDACDQIEAGFKVRMTLLHQLESYVEADLQSVYHDLNSHLVARSILPHVRVGARRAAGPQAAPKRPK